MRSMVVIPVAIFFVAVLGLIATATVPSFIPVYEFPLGRLLYDWNLWVIDRGLVVGAEVKFRELLQAVISLIVLVAAIFVILAKRYKPTEKHWAFGAVGTILGFWLKG